MVPNMISKFIFIPRREHSAGVVLQMSRKCKFAATRGYVPHWLNARALGRCPLLTLRSSRLGASCVKSPPHPRPSCLNFRTPNAGPNFSGVAPLLRNPKHYPCLKYIRERQALTATLDRLADQVWQKTFSLWALSSRVLKY